MKASGRFREDLGKQKAEVGFVSIGSEVTCGKKATCQTLHETNEKNTWCSIDFGRSAIEVIVSEKYKVNSILL